jgi:hypothetical protein
MRRSGNDAQGSPPGLGLGVFEFSIIKVSHLGLCQAAGFAMAVAVGRLACKNASSALWALSIFWLLSFPVGFTLFLINKLHKAISQKDIRFSRKTNGGSWTIYFGHIRAAKGLPERFCRPEVTHIIFKLLLALGGALSIFLAISAATDPDRKTSRVVLLFVFGFLMLLVARFVSKRTGRRLVLLWTNVLASYCGNRFEMLEGGAVVQRKVQRVSYVQKLVIRVTWWPMMCFIWTMAWIQAKLEAMVDPDHLWELRHRGKWTKEDSLKTFYGEYNDRGAYFAVFLMIKNILLGMVLADNPSMVQGIRKVVCTNHSHD